MNAWGTLYLVRPDWDGDDDEMDQAVVEAYEPVKSFLDVAPELWRLAGDEARAVTIESLVERVYDRERSWMNAAEIEELIRLLEGLEEELLTSVVDEHWWVRPERLPELRTRTRTLDLDETGGKLTVEISGVSWLYRILCEARDRGLLVALD